MRLAGHLLPSGALVPASSIMDKRIICSRKSRAYSYDTLSEGLGAVFGLSLPFGQEAHSCRKYFLVRMNCGMASGCLVFTSLYAASSAAVGAGCNWARTSGSAAGAEAAGGFGAVEVGPCCALIDGAAAMEMMMASDAAATERFGMTEPPRRT